jgi:hypothetical protein
VEEMITDGVKPFEEIKGDLINYLTIDRKNQRVDETKRNLTASYGLKAVNQ